MDNKIIKTNGVFIIMEDFKPLHDCKYYLTHNNHDRPFCVYVDEIKKEVYVYERPNHVYYTEPKYYTILVKSFKPTKVFIGESPMNSVTEYSGGYGSMFDGNSILLKIDNNEYVFICEYIASFKTDNEIVKFISPIGNNDVPYPYAFDDKQNYYFMLQEDSGILHIPDISDQEDPYQYYYKIIKDVSTSENIKGIYMDDEFYYMTTHPYPSYHYDDLISRLGSPMYIQYKGRGQRKKIITREKFIELLKNYNKKVGLLSFNDVKIIKKGDW